MDNLLILLVLAVALIGVGLVVQSLQRRVGALEREVRSVPPEPEPAPKKIAILSPVDRTPKKLKRRGF